MDQDLLPFKRDISGDNSCLFSAIGYLAEQFGFDDMTAHKLREQVAGTILSQPEKYNEGILGEPIEKYVERIVNPKVWGGAIETQILAEFYGIEICVFNIKTGLPVFFGDQHDYTERIYLLYDNVHYDSLVMVYDPAQPHDFDICRFPIFDGLTFQLFESFIQSYKELHRPTGLECQDCKALFDDEKSATKHAKETTHLNFKEIKLPLDKKN